ncbi:MAG: PQQ-binding-like beta-propeller repeat protein [Proteobacteria bacterium]|nr:PQQ-binding-like beta-propeller repeat protein [Pseudomonadota bacterium]
MRRSILWASCLMAPVALSIFTSSCMTKSSKTKDIVTDLQEGGKTYHYRLVSDELGERLVRGECIGGITASFCENNLQGRRYSDVKTKLTEVATLPRAKQVQETIDATNILIKENNESLDSANKDLKAMEALLATKKAAKDQTGDDLDNKKKLAMDLKTQETKLKERLAASPNDQNIKSLLATVSKELSDVSTKINVIESLNSEIAKLEETKTQQTALESNLTAQKAELFQRLVTLAQEKTSIANTLSQRISWLFKLLEDKDVGYRILTANDLFPDHRGDMAFLNTAFEGSQRALVKVQRFKTDSEVWSTPAILNDGTVVVASLNGFVYWLKDGKELFKFEIGGLVKSSPAIMNDGTIVVGSDNRHVYWLKDGKEVFKFKTDSWVESSPAIMNDGTVVIGSNDDHIYWLKDGKEVFKFKTGGPVRSSPAIMNDGTVVIGSNDRHVYWLKDGKEVFKFKTGNQIFSSPAIMNGGTVVVGSLDYNVYWLKDGKEVFKFKTGDWVKSSPAIMNDGTVVIGSNDNHVYWLKDGKEVIKFAAGRVISSPLIMNDGTVVVGSGDMHLYWLKDGKKVLNFRTGGGVQSSPVIMNDDTIVVGSHDDNVYWLKY